MLKKWAKDQESKGLTTTGVHFNLPSPEDSKCRAFYAFRPSICISYD